MTVGDWGKKLYRIVWVRIGDSAVILRKLEGVKAAMLSSFWCSKCAAFLQFLQNGKVDHLVERHGGASIRPSSR